MHEDKEASMPVSSILIFCFFMAVAFAYRRGFLVVLLALGAAPSVMVLGLLMRLEASVYGRLRPGGKLPIPDGLQIVVWTACIVVGVVLGYFAGKKEEASPEIEK